MTFDDAADVRGDDHVAAGSEGAATLRDALAYIAVEGFGSNVDADAIVHQAAAGLMAIYDTYHLDLDQETDVSAADVCADLYRLLAGVGLAVN